MASRFATYPKFATGANVVLDDDSRLGGTYTDVPDGKRASLPANRQHIAYTRLAVTGTLVLDGTLIMI